MTFIGTNDRFMRLGDSEKLLPAIFTNYSNLERCHPAPRFEQIGQVSAERRN